MKGLINTIITLSLPSSKAIRQNAQLLEEGLRQAVLAYSDGCKNAVLNLEKGLQINK